jgi:hypothetical protein
MVTGSKKPPTLSLSTPDCTKILVNTKPTVLNIDSVRLSFQTFPSCSRNWGLFGRVGADFREACQMVSTISRSKFRKHKPPPTHSQMVWLDRAQ